MRMKQAVIELTSWCTIILIFGIFQAADGQTIPVRDIPLFLGRMDANDSSGYDVFKRPCFVEWRLDSVDSNGTHASFRKRPAGKGTWYRLRVDGQNGAVWGDPPMNSIFGSYHSGRPRYYFYLMEDVEGYGGEFSILTVWEHAGNDSVRFICASQSEDYGGNLSAGWVKRAVYLPDNSYLVCIETEFADDCDWSGTMDIFKGTLDCNFQKLYSKSWGHWEKMKCDYDFDYLTRPLYQALETNIYLTADTSDTSKYCPTYRIDSAASNVLDLWELAKSHFRIETK